MDILSVKVIHCIIQCTISPFSFDVNSDRKELGWGVCAVVVVGRGGEGHYNDPPGHYSSQCVVVVMVVVGRGYYNDPPAQYSSQYRVVLELYL